MRICTCLSSFRKVIHKGSPRAEKKFKHMYDEVHDSVDKLYREEYQNSWYTWRMTPSEIRKKALQAKANLEEHHVCVMGVGQILGKCIRKYLLSLAILVIITSTTTFKVPFSETIVSSLEDI